MPDGRAIGVMGEAELRPQALTVPGDISSAAFPLVAALIVPGSRVVLTGVGINPTRDGLLRALAMMGADIALTNVREVGGEPVADLVVTAGTLTGVDVPPEIAPAMIDEYPALFVAAAFACGTTTMRGLAELRVKESDRIATMAAGLAACGVAVEELPDGLIVHGRGGDLVPGGAMVAARLDHRIAMSFAVLGLRAAAPVTVDDAAPVATSFPGFVDLMTGLGARAGAPPRGGGAPAPPCGRGGARRRDDSPSPLRRSAPPPPWGRNGQRPAYPRNHSTNRGTPSSIVVVGIHPSAAVVAAMSA